MIERVARIDTPGPPENIQWQEIHLPAPGPGEVRMRTRFAGLNFIDVYHRSGLYPLTLPSGLGVEAAGVVEALGEGVKEFAIGERVCTFGPALGAYASARNVPAGSLFAIPENVSDEIAAAALLKTCTVEFLVERCARVEPGWPVLVHAAAGGVGLLLVQWLKRKGAFVIGSVSSEDKARIAREAGADEVFVGDFARLPSQIREWTQGQGVRVVFDGIGAASWLASLDSTARRGLIVSYGNASGPVTAVSLGILAQKGSLFVTRPTLYDYYRDPVERESAAKQVFGALATGAVRVHIGQQFALYEAADAHRALEARQTIGSTILRA